MPPRIRLSECLPAGSTFSTRNPHGTKARDRWEFGDRWEFVGAVAPEPIRTKYVDRAVDRYFSPHSQNPIQYVNC